MGPFVGKCLVSSNPSVTTPSCVSLVLSLLDTEILTDDTNSITKTMDTTTNILFIKLTSPFFLI